MNRIIFPEEIKEYEKTAENIDDITNDDIELLNYQISSLFKDEWAHNPSARQVLLSEHPINGIMHDGIDTPKYAMQTLLRWDMFRVDKLGYKIISMMRDSGYIFVDRGERGIGIKIIDRNGK